MARVIVALREILRAADVRRGDVFYIMTEAHCRLAGLLHYKIVPLQDACDALCKATESLTGQAHDLARAKGKAIARRHAGERFRADDRKRYTILAIAFLAGAVAWRSWEHGGHVSATSSWSCSAEAESGK